MSGHYLQTTNPEAVDQIGGEASTLPDVGTSVVYLCRPGEGRSGRMEFPALVMYHARDPRSLGLLVIYAVDDSVEMASVPEFSEAVQHPAWRHVRGSEPEKFDPSRLNQIRKDLDATRKTLDETIGRIYGEWAAPSGSLMDFLVKFEGTLKAMEKRLAALEPKPAKKTK
jgi:hypothetical protein